MGPVHHVFNLAVALSVLLMILATAVVNAQSGERPLRLVALGDSLTAGYGLRPGQSFPDVLQKALTGKGVAIEVINAGVSGDTTSGGLERLDWAVPDDADAVIVELGANDALRGLPPESARRNLDAILTRLSARGLPVLLAGMRAPENWGSDYRDKFASIYSDLAQKHGAILYPFFLEGVALNPKLNIADGLHPNALGIARIVERMLPTVEELIEKARQRRTAPAAGKS